MKSLVCLLLTVLIFSATDAVAAKITLRSSLPPAAPFVRGEIEVKPVLQQRLQFPVGDLLASASNADRLQPSGSRRESVSSGADLRLLSPVSGDVQDVASSKERRHTFKERVLTKLLKKHFSRFGKDDGEPADPRRLRMGRLALVFGAGAFLVALVPILGILSPLMAIAGVVLGIMSLKGNTNIPGILGICFGAAFLLLILAVIAVFVIGGASWF